MEQTSVSVFVAPWNGSTAPPEGESPLAHGPWLCVGESARGFQIVKPGPRESEWGLHDAEELEGAGGTRIRVAVGAVKDGDGKIPGTEWIQNAIGHPLRVALRQNAVGDMHYFNTAVLSRRIGYQEQGEGSAIGLEWEVGGTRYVEATLCMPADGGDGP